MNLDTYCRSIIRPPRREYHISDLGCKVKQINSKQIVRVDFQFTSRNQKLSASYFMQHSPSHRCAIYLHGNASCRLEGLSNLDLLSNIGINLCVFDFAGCGMSEGDYITMGYNEGVDVLELMNYIETNFGQVDEFILWGRSMGAVTALMLSSNPKIKHYIIDSAFTNFRLLLEELGNQRFGMLSFLIYFVLPFLRKKIIEEAKFDIDQINPIKNMDSELFNKQFFFLAGKNDQLINYRHSLQLYESCRASKLIEVFEGDHNSMRPRHVLDKVQQFLNHKEKINQLNLEYLSNYERIHKAQTFQMMRELDQEQEELNQYKRELEKKAQIQQFKRDMKENRDYDVSDLDQYF